MYSQFLLLFNSNMYFTFHAVRFAAVFAVAGKNIVILLVTLLENLDCILSKYILVCLFVLNFCF